MIESFKPKLQFSLFNVLLVFFICWTILMGVTTWNIQNSCQPMIGSKCIEPPIIEPPIIDPPIIDPPIIDPPIIDPVPDAVGVAAGGAAITGLAIVEAPVLAVVAAGVVIWFLVRTTIKLINGS
ncbi:MAG: hypothetical protein HEP80_00490 [Dolichospermum sp. UKL201]|jgi:hypothetical protein|nr:MAG: hypothetical protein HEP80_00490 [Dolichospermum sp. UKL201]